MWLHATFQSRGSSLEWLVYKNAHLMEYSYSCNSIISHQVTINYHICKNCTAVMLKLLWESLDWFVNKITMKTMGLWWEKAIVIVVVVVFYWPLGSKQISRSIYIHITHTQHGKKLTSTRQSNKEINIASVSVDFVWYMIVFPNMLKQAYKFYSEMRYHITVPMRAHHAATTQPIPIFRLLQQSG